jgi:hypothetical protein
MAQTFGDVVRAVRGHCALAPALLTRAWVQNSANKIADRRPWSHLRGEGEIYLQPSRTGTVTLTQGSDLVAPGTLTFSAADVGRQLKVLGGGIPATVIAFAAPNAQIDRPWVEVTQAAATARVVDAYVTMPEDFGRFLAVVDPAAQWLIYHWVTEDELNFRDPGRQETGQTLVLASRRLASAPASVLGRVQYEAWPYADSARKLQYYYIKRGREYADDDFFEGVFRHRPDILLLAALAEACEWPGAGDQRNPYFRLELADRKKKQLEAELEQLETRDEEIYMTWLETVSWINRYRFAPMDSNWIRAHDVY